MGPETIYCHGEPGEFPADQFLHNREDRSLYVPYVHNVEPLHWAATGDRVDPDVIPGLAGVVAEISLDIAGED